MLRFNRLLTTIILSILIVGTNIYGDDKELYFPEDGRTWVFNGQTQVGEQSYIPQGQDPKNWEEAIIIHSIPSDDISLDAYYQNFMNLLNKKSGNIFQSKIVEEDENHLIFEWWVDHTLPDAQHGWIRVTKVPGGLQFFRFTTKNIDEIDTIRGTWESILSQYMVQTIPEKVDVRVNFSKDPRKWSVTNQRNGESIYYPEGETDQNWQEQLTIKILPGEQPSPYEFYYNFIKQIEEEKGVEVSSQVIGSNSDSIFFRVSNEEMEGDEQLVKFQIYPSNIGSLIKYVSRGPKDKESSELWKDIINDSTVRVNYSEKVLKED